jgi:hypothetical protein
MSTKRMLEVAVEFFDCAIRLRMRSGRLAMHDV